MRIGVDLDDTIFCTNQQFKKYQVEYLRKHKIKEEELWENRHYRVDYIKNNISTIFSDVKLKDNCVEILNRLAKDGHEIYIVTARKNDYCDDMYRFTKKSLEKFEIPYAKLVLTEKYKLESCIENEIDLMIDDSKYVCDELKSKVKTILFDDQGKHLEYQNRVSNWEEIYDLLVEGKI